jgi:Domain of unknown function (DUF5753)/Helix-turn-helix domain
MAAQTRAESQVPRRVLGRYLRELRQRARLPVRVAAGALEWSEPKLWRVETGQTLVRSLDVEVMCKIYGAPSSTARALMGLARQARAGGWWRPYDESFPEDFSVYAVLEDEASELLVYATCQVPPLMRTQAYARALISAGRPGADAGEVDRLVDECLARQVLLTRVHAPVAATVILDEAVLRCPAGGAQVMAEQLRHLAGLAGLPSVGLRVMPFSAGLHPGATARPFTLLRFPVSGAGPQTAPDTVYVGGLTGELYLDKPEELQSYNEVYAAILGCSLGQDDSLDMLLTAAKELEHGTG